MTARPRIVLASASPRRVRLLRRMGLDPVVDPAEVAETPRPGEEAAECVERLAREKVAAVASRHPDAWVVGGDTVVVLGGSMLGKPAGPDEAVAMLLSLSGRDHQVLTGLALALPGGEGPGEGKGAGPDARTVLSRVDVTEVRFRSFGRATAEAYVATGEPLDKAGAYGIQGLGAALVKSVRGDYHTVVGLSIAGLVELLEEGGLRYAFPDLVPRRRPDGPTER